MRLLERKTYSAIASLAACCVLWCSGSARGNINIELRSAVNTAAPNANVNIGLYLVSDNLLTQYSIAADVVFGWDNTRLQFLGIQDPPSPPYSASFMPADNNLNEVVPPQDGNGFYQMLGNFGSPVPCTPAGTLITTFRFKALSTDCDGANFTILPSGGSPTRNTRVLSGIVPNLNVTGTLGSSLVFIDGVAPIINSCAPAQIIPAGATCQGTMPNLTGLLSVTDNCPNLTITQMPLAGTILALGPHPVQIQVRDPGNNIAVCNTNVTVVDQTGPIITQCPSSQSVTANANCQAAIPNLAGQVISSDACSPPVTITQSPTAGTVVGLGPTVVTLTATDAALNTATCEATITVEDQTAPQITTCPSNQTIAADASCQAAIPSLTGSVVASDNCTPTPSLVISQSPTAGTPVGLGAHPVTISVKDAANNEATCPVVITVADQTDPVISQCAASQTIPANGSCQALIPNLIPQVIASDNCTLPASLVISQSPTAGTLVGIGDTVVTLTVTDAALNDTTCLATITVADQTGPVISQCASAQTVAADANRLAAIPDLTPQVIATDACSNPVTITQSPTAGAIVGLGAHPVTLTATDAVGNFSTCVAIVTVADQTDPVISQCAPSPTIAADAACQAMIPDLTAQVIATDICSPPVIVTQSPTAGTVVGLGPHTVTFTATDAANNSSTCDAVVTVEDQAVPSITTCAAPQTLAADGNCQAAIPDLTPQIIANDNCTPALSLVISQSPIAGTLVGLGLHNVTISVTDAANNEATCVVAITVEDQTDPVITTCAGPQTIAADANCQAAIPDLTLQIVASDNCTPTPGLLITQSPIAGTLVGLGLTDVTLTVEDAAGNDSTCVAAITIADQSDPQITTCPGAQSAVASASCDAAVPDFTAGVVANDNCTLPANLIVTQSPTVGTLVGVGPTNVTLTVMDAAGNDTTCVAVFTVLDQTDPQITTCAASVTIAAGATCQANIPDLTAGVVATDNCTPALSLVITQSPVAGAPVGLGPTVVTITVQDAASNSDTCDVTVTVEDQTAPVLTPCPANIVTNTNAGSCSAVVSWTEPTAIDNCGTPTVTRTQGPAPGSTFAANSTTTIEYTATDAANNTITCSFTVTVTPSPDVDNDNDVDVNDIPIFINVLLGTDTDPVRVARADVNCDGSPNGLDIQPFVDILTP